MPESDVAFLAKHYLSQCRTVSAPWCIPRSLFERVVSLDLFYGFWFHYEFLLTSILLTPVYTILSWALQPLWLSIRDWKLAADTARGSFHVGDRCAFVV